VSAFVAVVVVVGEIAGEANGEVSEVKVRGRGFVL
jgi:hypothetical protein